MVHPRDEATSGIFHEKYGGVCGGTICYTQLQFRTGYNFGSVVWDVEA